MSEKNELLSGWTRVDGFAAHAAVLKLFSHSFWHYHLISVDNLSSIPGSMICKR